MLPSVQHFPHVSKAPKSACLSEPLRHLQVAIPHLPQEPCGLPIRESKTFANSCLTSPKRMSVSLISARIRKRSFWRTLVELLTIAVTLKSLRFSPIEASRLSVG